MQRLSKNSYGMSLSQSPIYAYRNPLTHHLPSRTKASTLKQDIKFFPWHFLSISIIHTKVKVDVTFIKRPYSVRISPSIWYLPQQFFRLFPSSHKPFFYTLWNFPNCFRVKLNLKAHVYITTLNPAFTCNHFFLCLAPYRLRLFLFIHTDHPFICFIILHTVRSLYIRMWCIIFITYFESIFGLILHGNRSLYISGIFDGITRQCYNNVENFHIWWRKAKYKFSVWLAVVLFFARSSLTKFINNNR